MQTYFWAFTLTAVKKDKTLMEFNTQLLKCRKHNLIYQINNTHCIKWAGTSTHCQQDVCAVLYFSFIQQSAKRKPNVFSIYGVTLEVISLKLDTYNWNITKYLKLPRRERVKEKELCKQFKRQRLWQKYSCSGALEGRTNAA